MAREHVRRLDRAAEVEKLVDDLQETEEQLSFRRIRLPGLRLVHSERRLLLLFVDLLCLSAALVVSVALWTDWGGHERLAALFMANIKWLLSLGAIWAMTAAILDGYDLAKAASAPHSILTASLMALITVVIYHFTPYVTPPLSTRGPVFAFGLLAGATIALWRGIYAIFFVQPAFEEKGLVLGAGRAGRALARTLSEVPQLGNPYYGTGYHLLGFLDDDGKKQGHKVEGIPVLGDSGLLPELAEELQVDEVILAITHRHTMSQDAFDAIMSCRERGIRVSTMPTLYERLLGRVPVEHVGRDLNVVLPHDPGSMGRVFWMYKTVVDRGISLLGLVALAGVTPMVAAANAIGSPGPLFFRQVRVGYGGQTYEVLKFRTMIPDAEKHSGAVWSSRDDPRITPVGRFLRRTRLDELPQLINVLKGEMSLVGPRPERPEFVDKLNRHLPFYRARHAVKPGLTGWAQVRYGYGNSMEDSRIKLEYDLYYVKHAGFYLDALILLKTLAVVFKLQGS